jgi:hypothetical protein
MSTSNPTQSDIAGLSASQKALEGASSVLRLSVSPKKEAASSVVRLSLSPRAAAAASSAVSLAVTHRLSAAGSSVTTLSMTPRWIAGLSAATRLSGRLNAAVSKIASLAQQVGDPEP